MNNIGWKTLDLSNRYSPQTFSDSSILIEKEKNTLILKGIIEYMLSTKKLEELLIA